MSEPDQPELPRGDFTRNLRRLNGYQDSWLRDWVFQPGMRFGETEKWWQPATSRLRPHEGLDLLIFKDDKAAEQRLLTGTKIPPLLSGVEVGRFPDVLGETTILAHDFLDAAGRRLHTFYAHLQPGGAQPSGKIMISSRQVGEIAAPRGPTPVCPPHLHLSLAWVDKSYQIDKFRWEGFCASKAFRPGDPLALI